MSSSGVCPTCGTKFQPGRLYTVKEVAAELGVSEYAVRGWMARQGLVFRVWRLGRGRVARRIQWSRLQEFLDGYMPEFSDDSQHKACKLWKWRRDNGRKGQAAMIEARRKKKHAQNLEYLARRALREAQGSTIAEPGSKYSEPSSKP